MSTRSVSPPTYHVLSQPYHVRRKPLNSSSAFFQRPADTLYEPVSMHTHPTQAQESTATKRSIGRPSKISKSATSITYEPVSQVWEQSEAQQLWTSFWLRRSVLFAFTILFACLAAALVAIWRVSVDRDGFPLLLSTSHYAWTYGPTAILVLVIGLWRQVLYYCKTTQAWQEMKKQATPSERSILLDYIWPTIPTSLWKSAQYRHIPVTASILGFLLLKLVTVTSTTLLAPQSTPVSVSVALQLQSVFQRVQLPETPLSRSGGFVRGYYEMTPDGPMQAGTSLESIHAYTESLDVKTSGNNGTQGNLAFSTIQLDLLNSSITDISATVPASETKATCEVANVTLYEDMTSELKYISFGLDTSSCRAGHQNIRNSTGQLVNQTAIPGFKTWPVLFRRVFCGDDINRPGNALLDPTASFEWEESTPYTYQYAIIVTSGATDVVSDQNENITAQDLPQLASQNVSAILCKIEYNINSMKLTKNLLSNTYSIDGSTPGPAEKMANLTDIEYSEVIWSTIYGSGTEGPVQQDQEYVSNQMADAMVSLIETTLGKSTTTPRLIDPEELREAAVRVLDGVGTHLMSSLYTASQPHDTAGQATRLEDRLHVRALPLWIMIAGFILISLITLVINFTVIRNVLCHDPSSLVTHALVLAQSPSIQERLRGGGTLQLTQIKERMTGLRFRSRSTTENEFSVEVTEDAGTILPILKDAEKEKKTETSWMPLPARKSVVTVTLILPLTAIVVLEVLYRFSLKNQGIVNVTSDDAVTSYAIRSASTVVALILATVLNNLDSVISVFSVFSMLQSGLVPARRSIFSRLNGYLPPAAFYVAIRDKHYGAAVSNAASTLGAFLTIIASGLWVYNDNNTVQLEITATQTDPWNPQWDSSLTDNNAAFVFNEVQHQIVPLPPTIWTDFVFPDISDIRFEGGGDQHTFSNASVEYLLSVPALRPVLSCRIIPAAAVNVTENISRIGATQSMWTYYDEVEALANIADTCGRFSDNPLGVAFVSTGCCGNTLTDSDVGGMLLNSQISPRADVDLTRFNGTELAPTLLDLAQGCPSLGAVYADYTRDMAVEAVTAIMCYQQIQQVTTKVTYTRKSSGDIVVDQTHAPIPDESTVRNLTNSTTGFDSFEYDIIPWVTNSTLTRFEAEPNLDTFFDHLVHGPDGISATTLANTTNQEQSVRAIEALYRKYMVHVIDLNFRGESKAVSSLRARQSSSELVVRGTATGPTQPRLHISFTSKLILQVILGVTTILGAIAYMLVDLRGTIPRNPCSIASAMALFAGSEMCKTDGRVDDGSGTAGLMQRWRGQEFSLGWWESGAETTGERFGIDVGRAGMLGFRERRGWKEWLRVKRE